MKNLKMKKTTILFTILISLTLAGCQNQETTVVLDDAHCNKFRDVLEIQTVDTEEIEEIFYSPKTESCLYIVRGKMGDAAEAGALVEVHTYDWFVKWVWEEKASAGAISWEGNLVKEETKKETIKKAKELYQEYR